MNEEQHKFCPERARWHSLTLKIIMIWLWEFSHPLYMCFVDFEKTVFVVF